jgi:hypothetical protein
MDPFLEDPAGWGDVHFSLIGAVREQLAEAVSPHFFVGVERRVYIVSPDDEQTTQTIVPDVYLVSTPSPEQYGALAAEITMPLLIEPQLPFEVREHYLEIRDVKNRQVVTTIELLSPGNKIPGNEAYKAFKEKREEVRYTPVHWIEIDLLRAGERLKEVAGKSNYYALLKRGRGPRPYEVWLFNLRDRLPTIAVPLRPPFADVPLNLQTAFETMYQRAHYADALDYEESIPLPRLQSADAAWVEEQVQTWLAAREQ